MSHQRNSDDMGMPPPDAEKRIRLGETEYDRMKKDFDRMKAEQQIIPVVFTPADIVKLVEEKNFYRSKAQFYQEQLEAAEKKVAPDPHRIEHRNLLKWYIHHVMLCEGTNFIDETTYGCSFTPAQIAELTLLANEAKNMADIVNHGIKPS